MNLKSMTLPELAALFKEMGEPVFRAKQVYGWLHKGVRTYDEMTNLPQSLRAKLAQAYPVCPPEVVRKQESARDGTIKYLWKLSDGNCVETVLMRLYNIGAVLGHIIGDDLLGRIAVLPLVNAQLSDGGLRLMKDLHQICKIAELR